MSDNYNFEEDDTFYDDEDIPRFNRWKLIGGALALVIVVGFGIGIWYAYDQGVKKGVQLAPPIIKADNSTVKKIPEDREGMDIPHQDKKVFKVLEPEKEEKVETLMSPPEKAIRDATPVDVAENPTDENKRIAQQAETLMKKGGEVKKDLAIAVESGKKEIAAVAKSIADGVKKLEEKAINETPAPAAPKKVEEPVKVKAIETEKKSPAPVKVAEKKAEPKKEIRPEDVNFRVQLGAFRSTDAAEKAWIRLQKAHLDLLGGIVHRVQSVEIKGKGMFYRLQAGAFVGKEDASTLCTGLKAQKQDCLIAKK